MSMDRRRQMIEPEHGQLSIVQQGALLSISRPGFYHEPTGRRRRRWR
jgi:putative transposase